VGLGPMLSRDLTPNECSHTMMYPTLLVGLGTLPLRDGYANAMVRESITDGLPNHVSRVRFEDHRQELG
jgi:hypothetical protein